MPRPPSYGLPDSYSVCSQPEIHLLYRSPLSPLKYGSYGTPYAARPSYPSLHFRQFGGYIVQFLVRSVREAFPKKLAYLLLFIPAPRQLRPTPEFVCPVLYSLPLQQYPVPFLAAYGETHCLNLSRCQLLHQSEIVTNLDFGLGARPACISAY